MTLAGPIRKPSSSSLKWKSTLMRWAMMLNTPRVEEIQHRGEDDHGEAVVGAPRASARRLRARGIADRSPCDP